MTIDISQFYQIFFEEAAEHLTTMESLLLDLNIKTPDLEALHAIFRAAHSIKGGAGTFGFNDMTESTHVMESLLDRLRNEELSISKAMVDALLASVDILRQQLAHHQGLAEEVSHESIAHACKRLEEYMVHKDYSVTDITQASSDPDAIQMTQKVHSAAQLTQYSIIFLNIPAPISLKGLEAEISRVGVLDKISETTEQIVYSLASTVTKEEIDEILSFVLNAEHYSIEQLAAEQSLGTDDPGYGFFDEIEPVSLSVTNDQEKNLAQSAVNTAHQAKDPGYGFFEANPGAPVSKASNLAKAVVPDDGFGFFDEAPGVPEKTLETSEKFVKEQTAPPQKDSLKSNDIEETIGRRQSDQPEVSEIKSGRRASDKVAVPASDQSSIRVSVEKVDQMLNLVGELVITQSMLMQVTSQIDPAIYEQLSTCLTQLDRNTRDLQESVMSIRMMPISFVFSRFPRVVRDLAGRLGKEVELKTVGEATELDRGLIEKIADPLTHLVRNSLDHGIEMPDIRRQRGKTEKGVLTLTASHQGGHIVIEVKDDGGGLNRQRILEKARERGLAVHDTMHDKDVWNLIFEAGFSTAAEVTDVSGRGVGMDVVKRNIQGLGGTVDIESCEGVGTCITIHLPLTLAILDGMSVGVGDEVFVIPLASVVESLKPEQHHIHTIGGDRSVLHVREEYIPMLDLQEVFSIEHQEGFDRANRVVVTVEAHGRKAAMWVDHLIGQPQVVIKSLESNYRKVKGFSGATIMGDGRVALIMDVTALVNMVNEVPGRAL